MPKTTTFEHGGRIYEVRAIPTLNGWMVRIFIDGIPANGFTYSVNSEIYQDAALNRVPEDLVAGLMETAERDFRRGLLQELMTAEKATDDDIAAEIDKFKPWERPKVRAAELAAKAIDTMVPSSESADEREGEESARVGRNGREVTSDRSQASSWTDTHPELQKIGVKKIAKSLKRTPGATGVKAAKLGVSLDTRG
jgi:hypothetical protein